MPKIDVAEVPLRTGSSYPPPYDAEMAGRSSLRLADAGGLSQFGVNLVILAPGAKSSLRHWHLHEDEFAMVTQGRLVLIENDGEAELAVGDCAAWPAGEDNGHHLVNRSDAEARVLVVGTRAARETAHYSDIDMKVEMVAGKGRFTRRDGSALGDPE